MQLKKLNGYVSCSLRGKNIELFINMGVRESIQFWDMKIIDGKAYFSVSLADFFRLKPILIKTNTRIHVEERVGIPFFLSKIRNRKGLLVGFLFFMILIYLLSSMIWTIDIEGNDSIKDEEIYQVLDKLGVHEPMLKFKLPEQELIQKEIIKNIDGISWVGVKVKGTNINISVVEKKKPVDKESNAPRNIVSTKNAVIYKILAEKGLPKVKVNQRVKKGDILISGIMGTENNQQFVSANGEVLGVVWYESNLNMSLTQKWREYTGNINERKYISFSFSERMIRYKGPREIPYKNYQQTYKWDYLTIMKYQLPIVITTEKILEYEEKEQKLSENEAITIALEQTKADLFSKIEPDSKILSEKVLHQSIENGKVSIKVLYEVLEDITTTQPIIQGE